MKANFEIQRTDLTKDWASQQSRHIGSIELQLSDDKKTLNIAMEHTADEVHDINEVGIKLIKEYLVNKNLVNNKKLKKILFGVFDNETRVKFLLNLTNDQLDDSDTFEFKEITDVDISIDKDVGLPERISWMEDKIKNLKIKGESLHETELLKNPAYHKALIVSGIKAKYSFNSPSSNGECTFEFGFPSRKNIPDENSEFIYKLINFNYKSPNKTKGKVQGFLYAKFDNFKSNAQTHIKSLK
ncbi:hypothetical protein ACOI1C_21475 [Bacillus sp. DJP31]|uniref:hypothetical protein n=1 Tax=Bacillus sp. DJP31 TaxID=3409789 RepID=UPI003BB78A04